MKVATMKATVLLILTSLTLVTYNNCSRVDFSENANSGTPTIQETVVGNPLVSRSLASKLCSVVTRCHAEVSTSRCENEILNVSGIDYQFGLPKGSVSSFLDIVNAEAAGTYQSNSSGSQSCTTAIESLSCSDSLVQSAYDSNSSSPFAGIAKMIPTSPGSCPATFAQPLSRNEYYVSLTGNDSNDGSKDRPWATITNASQKLVLGADGAIVHVAPGTYSPTPSSNCNGAVQPCSVVTRRSGTLKAPITYISDQQWAAKIVPTNANTAWYNSGDYVQIIGFQIEGTAQTEYGIMMEGAFGDVIGNHVHHIPATKSCASSDTAGGIYFSWTTQTHDNNAIGNLVHDIGPLLADGLPSSSYCARANGITVLSNGGKIQNNLIYRVATWGFQSWYTASNLSITHNLIYKSGSRSSSGSFNGGALLLGSENISHSGTTVSNNIFRDNSGTGLREMSVGNNNLYASNVMYANGRNFDLVSGIVPVGTLTTDPQMVNFQADGSGDYHLRSTSPAVNSGSLTCYGGGTNCLPSFDFTGFSRNSPADLGPLEMR